MLCPSLYRRTYHYYLSWFVLSFCLLPGPLTAENQNWLPGFSSTGLSERALLDGADNINVVGQFTVTTAGFFQGPGPDGLRNYALAIWNGAYWRFESPTETSFGDQILTAVPLFFDICIGGTFTPTAVLPGGHVNCWNGRQWYEPGGPGGGPDGQVFTLAFDGEDIYAGGAFSLVGTTVANNVAQFDRDQNQWKAMAGGTSGSVSAMVSAAPAVSIYVGGAFDNAGGRASTQDIARWDPVARSWHEVGGGGVNGIGGVSDLSADGGFIYAAGGVTSLGGVAVDRVARTVVGSNTWAPLGHQQT